MSYTPEHQYRCTIVRGRSQGMMEDMLPHYAEIVHQLCPCTKELFVEGARKRLAKVLFKTDEYNTLPDGNKKTINNHLTETAGTLLWRTSSLSGVSFPVCTVLAPALRRPCSLQLPCLLNANSYLADEKVYSNICKNAHFMDFYLLIIENIRNFAAN